MWLIPTFRRPERLNALLQNPALTSGSSRIVIKYDPVLDPEADEILKDSWGLVETWPSPNVGCSLSLQWAYLMWPHEQTYGFIGDDCEPVEPDFFSFLDDAAGLWSIAYVDDGSALPRHCTIGGELIRAWTFWTPPGLYHGLCDAVWSNFLDYCPAARQPCARELRHYHHLDAALVPAAERTSTRYPQDDTHRLGETFIPYDHRAYEHFIQSRWWTAVKKNLKRRNPWRYEP